MPYFFIAAPISRRKSVQTWCPRPREPEWISTTTWPRARPMARAASSSAIRSTYCTSRKWLPLPSVPSCGRPRSLARSETWPDRRRQRPAGLGVFGIARLAVAMAHHPTRALDEHLVELLGVDLDEARAAGAAGHVAKDLVHQLAQLRAHLRLAEIGAHQPHAAIDIETDAARRDDAARHIGGADAADRKAVALVDVGHRQARADDAGQRRDVGGLFERERLWRSCREWTCWHRRARRCACRAASHAGCGGAARRSARWKWKRASDVQEHLR